MPGQDPGQRAGHGAAPLGAHLLMWREPGVMVAQALVLGMGGVKPGASAEGEPGGRDDGLWLPGSHILTLVQLFPAALPCSPSRSSSSSYSRTLNPQIINSAEKVTASGSHENLLSRGYLKLFLIFLDPCFLSSSNVSYLKKKKKRDIFFCLENTREATFHTY